MSAALVLLPAMIVPVVITIVGIIMKVNPPKKINGVVGYRTRNSKKSKEAWDYANRELGRRWTIAGIILLIATIVGYLIVSMISDSVASLGTFVIAAGLVDVVVLILSVLPIEKELKERF